MEEHDQIKTLKKEEIRRKIDEGWASAIAGRLHDGDEVFAELEAHLDAMEPADLK